MEKNPTTTGEAAFRETLDLLLSANGPLFSGYKPAFDYKKLVESEGEAYRTVNFIHPEKPPIQLVKLVWFDNPERVIDSFDFTISQFACNPCGGITMNPISLMDVADKRLVLHRSQFPELTKVRIEKYKAKGFTFDSKQTKTIGHKAFIDILLDDCSISFSAPYKLFY